MPPTGRTGYVFQVGRIEITGIEDIPREYLELLYAARRRLAWSLPNPGSGALHRDISSALMPVILGS